MRVIQTRPRDIRVGDLVEGRRVTGLELTRSGVLVDRVGTRTRRLFTEDGFVNVSRPDRVSMQALVQASATL